MRQELDDLLCQRYPKIFRDRHADPSATAMCWGFACGDGWFDLIDGLCRDLQHLTEHEGAPQLVATQVKEKFGSLRFRVQIRTASEAQEALIEAAIERATRTCNVCGAPGQARRSGRNQWIGSIRCPEHGSGDAQPDH